MFIAYVPSYSVLMACYGCVNEAGIIISQINVQI